MGGSEGGRLAIELADKTNPSICIALVGCGDQSGPFNTEVRQID